MQILTLQISEIGTGFDSYEGWVGVQSFKLVMLFLKVLSLTHHYVHAWLVLISVHPTFFHFSAAQKVINMAVLLFHRTTYDFQCISFNYKSHNYSSINS